MEHLKNKWLLLDTNVLIEQFLNYDDSFWKCFEKDLAQLNCKLIITLEIHFELFRRMRSEQDHENFMGFLERVRVGVFALSNPEGWERATKIGQLYALAKWDGIGAIDCILASYLQHYAQNLYLATFNNRDFPVTLFDRHDMLNFEIKNEIKVLSIY